MAGYGKTGQMYRNYRDKYNQQNTRDRRKNLRLWRYYRGNKVTGQIKR